MLISYKVALSAGFPACGSGLLLNHIIRAMTTKTIKKTAYKC